MPFSKIKLFTSFIKKILNPISFSCNNNEQYIHENEQNFPRRIHHLWEKSELIVSNPSIWRCNSHTQQVYDCTWHPIWVRWFAALLYNGSKYSDTNYAISKIILSDFINFRTKRCVYISDHLDSNSSKIKISSKMRGEKPYIHIKVRIITLNGN